MKQVLILFFLTLGCVSLGPSKDKARPKITEKMPLKEALANAIEFGGPTLTDVTKLIKKRKEWRKADDYLYKILMHDSDLGGPSLVNVMELFRASQSPRAHHVFKKFVADSTSFKRQLAWQLAADCPSRKMAHAVEHHLTEAVADNELNLLFVPGMADAVASNRLVDSYSIVREGLVFSNDISFARAMIALNPQQSSIDFLDYLAKAPVEELRQLTLKSVDVYTCTLILEHFRAFPPPASHPHIETLFLYSISRNNALAEMARDVLEKYLPKNGDVFALALARLPAWMQLAFVERSSKRLTPVISIFLDELRKVTADKDVAEEISALKI